MNFYSFTDRDIITNIKPQYLHEVITKYLECHYFDFKNLTMLCETSDTSTFRMVEHYFQCLIMYLHSREVKSIKKLIKNVFSITYDEKHSVFVLENEDSTRKFKITKNIIDSFNLFLLYNDESAMDMFVKEQYLVDLQTQINDEKKKAEKYEKLMIVAKSNLKIYEDEYKHLTSND